MTWTYERGKPYTLEIRKDLPEWQFVVRGKGQRWICEINQNLRDREEIGNKIVKLLNEETEQ